MTDTNHGRYMLFTWDDYEAQGGSDDVRGRFDTIAEAWAVARTPSHPLDTYPDDNWQVLDMATGDWITLEDRRRPTTEPSDPQGPWTLIERETGDQL